MLKANFLGLKDYAARIAKAPEKLRKDVGATIQFAGLRFRELAVKDLNSGMLKKPTAGGIGLSGSIKEYKISELSVGVVAGKKYAPFVEWGTITKVQVPSELHDYAIQFKGRGLRKNGGMMPRPYFFKQIPIVRKETIQQIETILTGIV